jgi:hypothetical protein
MSQQSNANPAFVHPYGPEPEIDIADPETKNKSEDEDLSLEEALSTL